MKACAWATRLHAEKLREGGKPVADRLATATLLTFAQATAGLSALAQLPPRDLMGAVEAISDKISL